MSGNEREIFPDKEEAGVGIDPSVMQALQEAGFSDEEVAAVIAAQGGDGDPDDDEDLEEHTVGGVRVDVGRYVSVLDGVALPKDVLADSRRRMAVAQTLMSLIHTTDDPERALVDLEEITITSGIAYGGNKYLDYTDRSFTCTVQLEDRDSAVEALLKLPDSQSKLRLFLTANEWRRSHSFEPHENPHVSGLYVSIETKPAEGHTRLAAQVALRPSSFTGSIDEIVKLAEVRNTVSHFPFLIETPHSFVPSRAYKPTLREIPRNHGVEDETAFLETVGVGRVYEFRDGMELLIETSAAGVSVVYQPNKKILDSIKDLDDEENRRKIMLEYVKKQVDFAADILPNIFGPILFAIDDETSGDIILKQARRRIDEEEMLKRFRRREEEEAMVPEILKDERQRELYRSVVQPLPETSFDMIGGLNDTVLRMRRAVRKAQHPELYKVAGLSPKATILLAGPPGCGKTMLAEAAARETDSIFLSAMGSDIMSMWAGEAEKNVAALFEMTQLLATEKSVVLLLDEIESLAPSRRNGHMQEYERKITAQFLAMLNREYPNCLIIAATNDPNHVDSAVIRDGRFNDIIEVGLPDTNGREEILTNWVAHFSAKADVVLFADDVDLAQLARMTPNFTGSELKTMIEKAVYDAVDAAIETEGEIQPIAMFALLAKVRESAAQKEVRVGTYL